MRITLRIPGFVADSAVILRDGIAFDYPNGPAEPYVVGSNEALANFTPAQQAAIVAAAQEAAEIEGLRQTISILLSPEEALLPPPVDDYVRRK